MSNAFDPIQSAAREQFAKQSERYGRGHILADVSDIEAALAPLHLPSGLDALDIATGGGHTAVHLAWIGHRVTAADIAEPMLRRAAELAASRGLRIETRLHAAEELPYPDASFDLVTCRVAAHHFSSPAAFVRETARVLRPGGHFLLIDGSVEDGQPEAEEWLHKVEKLRDPSHHRLLTPGVWSRLCEGNGLVVKKAELTPFKQPDLEWYFETAATPPENRRAVLGLVAYAPDSARKLFRIANEEGKITWWWQRLALVAAKVV
ncbi:MAG TPA: class I SAM-dependent methyltransferase [Chthoniobacteraceae bacterium]|nr:class I SAM-dependent methyltransferase [Chthoniobacteraceae bacterium]